MNELLRALPAVEELAARLAELPRGVAVSAARAAIAARRDELRAGATPAPAAGVEALVADARARAEAAERSSLRPVLNATGVIVHTNLGRAPLAAAAVDAVAGVAGGYSNLEYDLESGRRGSRQDHAEGLLRELTGARAA
ncbi:MAG: L-seryl-tRNA(Sec) selenium transferase, partial [Thermoleophilaceae bacterium]|nr:L-seryl-tRNA(Sec) selenium transferase [Thermoleophilaceae bacterium]